MEKVMKNSKNPWENYSGPNLAYLMDVYDRYKEDALQVADDYKIAFEKWGPPVPLNPVKKVNSISNLDEITRVVSATKLADYIRNYGHLYADLDPLNEEMKGDTLKLGSFQLTRSDLETLPAEVIAANSSARDGFVAIEYLKQCYTSTIGFEWSHVNSNAEKNWLIEQVESGTLMEEPSVEVKKKLIKKLTEVEEFENFLQRTFVGQKRFSVEGLDALVPMLEKLTQDAVGRGVTKILMGMSHRGRISVLAHVLGKPLEKIFAEFQQAPNKDLVPSEGSTGINFGWTGDVKYHLGADLEVKQTKARVTLANNPSHLEFVAPVVQGYTRAVQDIRTKSGYPDQDVSMALSVIIHGDAAFPGQGIVPETLNLSALKGYHTGGSIHIIANNMIGFTTASSDSRSTKYASDLAKGFEIPIIHVNADDPEACLKAMNLAFKYLQKFKQDFIIDLIGYRRYGHNEMDEPAMTQPKMYEKIRSHSTVKNLYKNKLIDQGIRTEEEQSKLEKEIQSKLQESYNFLPKISTDTDKVNDLLAPNNMFHSLEEIKTKVDFEELKMINDQLLTWPATFTVMPKLEKILLRRQEAFKDGGKIDWALAETLAFATILKDGTPIRLTGQDSERGTFAQRHIVLHDYKNEAEFLPLHQYQASFAIHNSPLSEAAVVGFEYGYSVKAQETLVIWEAQYGDFANGAQVIYDQFISAGRAKWGQRSGLVLLLPHGYEGQGPEHSSARIERFLQLSAENNWTIANLSSAAQYFHLLRRQAALLEKDYVRPLVITTPKSLLRHSLTASEAKDLAEGSFQSIIEEESIAASEAVTRLVLSSGKIAIELKEKLTEEGELADWLHLVRVEELYPFPKENLKKVIAKFPTLTEIVWVQEEPKNMGAWSYINLKIRPLAGANVEIRYIGRPYRSSPAEADPTVHKSKQRRIATETFNRHSHVKGEK